MGKKNRGKKKSVKKAVAPRTSVASPNDDANFTPGVTTKVCRKQAPVEPGREATITGLVKRTDLNETGGTIRKVLDSGRVAVEIVRFCGTNKEQREVVAIRRENLEVKWKTNINLSGKGVCPICMDTEMITGMDNNQNASLFTCCGGAVCGKCFIAIQSTEQRDVCPLCRADTSDCSDAAEVANIKARARRGCANAMYNLGGFYDHGLYGVAQDQAAARVWYQKSAEKGERRAAHNLACSYRDGEGGPVDRALAAKYFRMAAEAGHHEAATNLGIAYGRGLGVERDLEEARRWLTQGAEAGDELAVQELRALDQGGGTMEDMMSLFMAQGSMRFSCN